MSTRGQKEHRLVVLYFDNEGRQHWCAYGGHTEADSELLLMQKDGAYEVGRFWCDFRETYTPGKSPKGIE